MEKIKIGKTELLFLVATMITILALIGRSQEVIMSIILLEVIIMFILLSSKLDDLSSGLENCTEKIIKVMKEGKESSAMPSQMKNQPSDPPILRKACVSTFGICAGAGVGAAVGGPFAPITATVGGIIGGLCGLFFG
jgi:hypothetical protein